MKRLFDIIAGLLILILLSPILVLIGVLIRLETRGPAIFTQERVGLNGKTFSICKFRSMFQDSEKKGSHSTAQNDPRITRVGKFIRNTSLDELPQLINVVRGEMSIVGPRPDLMIQKSDYRPEDWDLRVSVRPGITGLAQVNGRSSSSFEARLGQDLDYARRHDFLLDMKIIFKTVGVVLSSRHSN